MREIMGKKFLTPKDASRRYGFSVEWFKLRRYKHQQPNYIKILGKGDVLYPLDETDEWFKQNMIESE